MSKRPLCVSPLCRSRGYHWDDCNTPDCRGCQPRLAADQSRLCHVCGRRLGEDIGTLAELHGELELVLAGAQSIGEKIASKPGPRLPNPAAVDARTEIRHTLVSWTLLVAEERGVSKPTRKAIQERPAGFIGPMRLVRVVDESTEGVAAFLRRHVDWLGASDYADEVADEFSSLVGRARRVAYPNGNRVIEVGNCTRETDGQPCEGVIKAILRRVDSLLPSQIVCDVDDSHTWDPTQWLRLGKQLRAGKVAA